MSDLELAALLDDVAEKLMQSGRPSYWLQYLKREMQSPANAHYGYDYLGGLATRLYRQPRRQGEGVGDETT